MLNTDVVELFIEHVENDEIRCLRDSLAKMEEELDGPGWEEHRQQHRRIRELRDKCEQAGHPLTIALAGDVGARRRLMRDGRNERRTCVLCGAEEAGTTATPFLVRLLSRRAVWRFEKLNGYVSRVFTDPEWYLETCSIIKNFSFTTRVLLEHVRPPRINSNGTH
jgi:hypothetical protein